MPVNTNKPTDNIVAIVDRSGSMMTIKDEAENGVNHFIKEQQELSEKEGRNCVLNVVEFDTEITLPKSPNMNIMDFKSYDLQPRGMTALLDAIGTTLTNTDITKGASNNGKTVCVIVTDGHENSSHEYNYDMVKEKVGELENRYGWEFVFIGAGIDAFAAGSKFGFSGLNSISIDKNNIAETYDSMSVYTSSVRTMNKADYDDVLAQEKSKLEGNK